MMSFILMFVVVMIILFIKKIQGPVSRNSMPAPHGFNPTFQFKDKIAIDTNQDVLMTKDSISGRISYVKRVDILRWNDLMGANGHFVLQIHVRDLQIPLINISFGRNSQRAHLAREEWYARLTTWVNNS